ncbi:mitochondrial rRNA methyltransferase 2 [Calliopsis andreniformis]|uniref:mitochondrial rRNA methyltransferase 2 n=1 Tax=Calliopsis andreniformis TaxID=337506 RepID=UPI003FCEB527
MRGLNSNFLIARNVHNCTTLYKKVPTDLKGRNHSSQLWLTRQIQDPYVEKAKKENYRCRSAFKLLEINEKYNILKPGQVVVDCGAAPGGWTQVAVKLTNANGKNDGAVGTVLGIDKQPMFAINGATLLGRMDFTVPAAQEELLQLLKGNKADVVLSDMAPNACGIRELDHDTIIKLAYFAFKFSLKVLKVNGTFLCKIWDGNKSQQMEEDLLKFFKSVKNVRPQATRTDSTEKFFLAREFKGIKSISNSTQ